MGETPGKRGFYGAAAVIAGATFLSRILGLLREQVFAFLFGAGFYTDAFQIAFRIPNLLRDLFAEGAMSSALVPIYTKSRMAHGEEHAWRLVRNVITSLGLVMGMVALMGVLWAKPLVALYAPGFSEVPGKMYLAVDLTRIMWPFLPMVVLAAVWMGVLNARERFGTPALSPTIFNVASIAAAFLICPFTEEWFGLHPIYGMAFGVLLGGLGQWLMQAPALHAEGFRYSFRFQWRDPELVRMAVLMGAGTLGLAATQINIFVNSVMASGEGDGAVSWLNYAFRLMQFPIGVFGVAISTATLTRVSREVAMADLAAVRKSVVASLRMVMTLTIPSSVGLAVFGTPIISAIYEHGQFTARDTEMTALALACYALGLSAYSAIKVLVPIFYSLGKSRVAVWSSGLSVVLNVAFCLLLVKSMGFHGLALATSIAALGNCAVLLWLIERHVKEIDFRDLIRCLVGVLGASAVMAVVLLGMLRWVGLPPIGAAHHGAVWWGMTLTHRLGFLFIGLILGVATFGGCARVTGVNEVTRLFNLVMERLWKSRELR
ncbi:MAG: murein biosynthesis integral membrane protein MurJ [Bdellovibrionales bacterium]|nr:murein biosynthesis integral membrane protein MurJ [Bdellovibrionales bacterium]